MALTALTAVKVRPVVHHAALDRHKAPAFLAHLRAREGMGAKASRS